MRVSKTVAGLLVTIGSLVSTEAMQMNLAKCPDLTRDELRRLCRWEGFSKIPLLGIKSGSIDKEGVTLLQNKESCGEKDSFRAFFKASKDTTFSGTFAANPSTITEGKNQIQTLGTCAYTLPTFTQKGGGSKQLTFDVVATQGAMRGFSYTGEGEKLIGRGNVDVRAHLKSSQKGSK